jgi:hypothetical protein
MDRRPLDHRPAGAGGQHRGAALAAVAIIVEDLAGPPVVVGLVVVPLREDRHLGGERADVIVLEVVGEARAEIVERFDDARDALVAEVAPDPAVGELLLGDDRVIGVDHVAGVEEHRGGRLAQRAVAEHAAPLGVAAKALAGGVAAPCDAEPISARPVWTSPLCTPCVMRGNLDLTIADRLHAAAPVDRAPITKLRRVSTATTYRNRLSSSSRPAMHLAP